MLIHHCQETATFLEEFLKTGSAIGILGFSFSGLMLGNEADNNEICV
jgi:hypothetical protein